MRGGVPLANAPAPCPPGAAPSWTCGGTQCSGNDVGGAAAALAPSLSACAARCAARAGCAAFTWEADQMCYLKRADAACAANGGMRAALPPPAAYCAAACGAPALARDAAPAPPLAALASAGGGWLTTAAAWGAPASILVDNW